MRGKVILVLEGSEGGQAGAQNQVSFMDRCRLTPS
jgi:hypothetical protein